jgi:hypothetical protein
MGNVKRLHIVGKPTSNVSQCLLRRAPKAPLIVPRAIKTGVRSVPTAANILTIEPELRDHALEWHKTMTADFSHHSGMVAERSPGFAMFVFIEALLALAESKLIPVRYWTETTIIHTSERIEPFGGRGVDPPPDRLNCHQILD